MSPERDEPNEDQEQELYEDVPPRSIFAATWFRVVLVVIVLGVIGAVAVPYVLDWMNPPPPPRTATVKPPGAALAPSALDRPADRPASDKPAADKSPAASDKKDMALTPAPAAPAPTTTPAAPVPAPATPARPGPRSEPKPAVATAAKPPADTKPAVNPAPAKPTPSEGSTKTASAVTDAKPSGPPKSESQPATATKPSAMKPAAAKASTPAAPATGAAFWVQVGAFKDQETAKQLATKLRDENFKVEESVRSAGATAAAAPAAKPAQAAPTAPSGSDQYDVHVSGMSVDELNKRLSGRGLAAEPSPTGAVVKPSLPLRDAVALSKDLAVEGFKVQVRRAGASAAAATIPAPASSQETGPALHRVRVGAFPDRATAQAAARELEAKGYKPFIARGDQ